MRLTCALLLLLVLPATVWAQGSGSSVYITSGSRTDQPAKPGQASDEASNAAHVLQDQVAIQIQNQYPCVTPTEDRDIAALMKLEKERSLLDPNYQTDLANMAGALGARYLISVTVTQMGGQLIMQAVVLDTATAKAIERFDRQSTSQNAVSDADSLARQVGDALGPLFAVKPQSGRTYPAGTVFPAVHRRTFSKHAHVRSTWTEALRWDEDRKAFHDPKAGEGDPALRCGPEDWGSCGGCADCSCSGSCTVQLKSPGRYRLVNVTEGLDGGGLQVEVVGEVTIAGTCKK